MRSCKGLAGLFLILCSAAQANEADDAIYRLIVQAQGYAATRSSEELARTLFAIAEALPSASASGISAVDELSRYLAGTAAAPSKQDTTLPTGSEPAASLPKPAEIPAAQSPTLPVERAVPEIQQREPSVSMPATAVTSQPSPALLELLRRQGAAALSSGDISGARRFYQRGAEAGCVPCAEVMAQTFDAEQLIRMGAIGIRPDPAQAEAWRARARQLARTGTP